MEGIWQATGIDVLSGATNANILGPGRVNGYSPGIVFRGSNTSMTGVTVTHFPEGILIVPPATGRSVRGNVVTNNDYGIEVQPGSTGNTIIGNFALNNFAQDLTDDNANCGSNVWRGNDFGTANPSTCIH